VTRVKDRAGSGLFPNGLAPMQVTGFGRSESTAGRRSLLHEKRVMTSRKNRGFSLLEMMIVCALGFTMVAITFITMMPMFKENHVDQAYDTTLSVFRNYRNLAITQTNRYIITFSAASTTPTTITVQLWGYSPPPAASPAPVTVATYTLPPDIQFSTWTTFPAAFPDGFGTGSTAIQFNACTVIATGNPCVIFYPDGSAQDDLGNYNNGLIYLTNPNLNVYSSRAIDIYGTTGRVRGWRIYNQSGVNVWTQQ
jgi:type II secretory pathway pseudopilin PulG